MKLIFNENVRSSLSPYPINSFYSLSKLEEDYSKKVEDAKRQSALEAAEKEQKLQEEVQK